MTNFEKITVAPEALTGFLGSLLALEGPWDNAFQGTYCNACKAKNCTPAVCMAPELYQDEQKRIAWWLRLEVKA